MIRISGTKVSRIIYMILLYVAGALILLFFAGTIFGLVRSSNNPILKLGKSSETASVNSQYDDIRVFSGIGRLRIPLSNSSILILSIAFPYSANDITFTEELAAKITDFRTIAYDYFSSLPAKDVSQINEEAAKAEILKRFNESLRLGRIQTLYFSDLMVLD
ncbi:MAG: hypothetical protein LBI12_04310 [Treponema sp.]|jgi:flagellar basal body-associated protein FliL|nr:hypothetical protein [Treponema sp.]